MMTKTILRQSFVLSDSDTKYYLILFLFWPFLAFLFAISNFYKKEARTVVYFFLIYFGLNFVISNPFMDSAKYVVQLERVALLPFSQFFNIVGGLYEADNSVDIYQPFITFLVSRLTTDHRVLFAVFASVFGFFYLKSISLLYNIYLKNPGWNALMHLIFFISILPITTINGVRMWTAAWIFFYGAIRVILYKEKKYLLLALCSTFVHWSFLSAGAILIIYYILGNRNVLYIPLTIVSFILPGLMLPFYSTLAMRFGGAIENRFDGYTSQGYIAGTQDIREQVNWFVHLGNELVFYYIIIALIVIQSLYKSFMTDKPEKNLYSFLLFFLAFVNFGMPIPSFGGRFQLVFFLFGTFYITQFFIKVSWKNINLLTLIGLFPMLIYTAVVFRIGADNLNVWIFTPGFGSPFWVNGLSVAELLF